MKGKGREGKERDVRGGELWYGQVVDVNVDMDVLYLRTP